jgi:hypothetical protein
VVEYIQGLSGARAKTKAVKLTGLAVNPVRVDVLETVVTDSPTVEEKPVKGADMTISRMEEMSLLRHRDKAVPASS